MKIWREPRCTLLAGTKINESGMASFMDAHNTRMPEESGTATDADLLPEIAGRLCYMSFGKKAGNKGPSYLKHILQVGHGSVLEHASFTVLLEGISRSLTHELVRHRAGCAYSQLSQRYVDPEDMGLVLHPAILHDDHLIEMAEQDFLTALDQYGRVVKLLMEKYNNPITMREIAIDQGYDNLDPNNIASDFDIVKATRTARRKMAREAAREWLPNMTETKIVTTMNVRAWRHFFNMRGAAAADKQIRRCAVLIFQTLHNQAPWCFQDITPAETNDGIGCLTLTHPKV